MSYRLVFLKLGGSLITVKDQPHTPRPEVLERLAQEISTALAQDPDLRILLGHGSGSYGHVSASLYHTRQGVRTTQEWEGYNEVRHQAAELDHLVVEALRAAHLPVTVFPPSSTVIARDGKVAIWDADPLGASLGKGLLPLIFGDVAYDQLRGGTILSTEDLFCYLAPRLKPDWLLFAGRESGVFAEYPTNLHVLKEITPGSFQDIKTGVKGSSFPDVTGGMLDKVYQLISLVSKDHTLQGMIFSGEVPGNVQRALLGEQLGTVIHYG
jgi:isopentenyl phosphate kinase